MKTPSIVFIHNFSTHYTYTLFEKLAKKFRVRFLFTSDKNQWYWLPQHGTQEGSFEYTYISGFRISRTKITPKLITKLLFLNYDIMIKSIDGKFALPISFIISKLRRKPFILYTGIWNRLDNHIHRLFFPVTQFIYRHSDAIVVYGSHVKKYLVSEGVRTEKIFIAPHAVNNACYGKHITQEDKTELLRKLQIDGQKQILLFLGRLEEPKGIKYLLQALPSIHSNNWVLILAGTGGQKLKLEIMIDELGLNEKVVFAGYVPIIQTPVFYSIATLFILPSITTPMFKEPWGLTINEAMNQGVPVITTNAVGAATGGLVNHGKTGFIIPERNTAALADAINRLLDNPELLATMRKESLQLIAGWNQDRMVEGFIDAVKLVSKS